MSQPGRQKPLILVVDDDEDVREIVSLLLSEEGFEVVTAHNGAVALEQLESGAKPNAIILDLMMPVMNGWEFWDRTQVGPHGNIPIIVLTATGLTQGAVGHARVLPKPVGPNELLAAVQTACARAA
jgi:two-component system chemotaxis response regulator CheY